MGYTGGASGGPTYRSLGDHSEAVEVDYDPRLVSYENLLEIFWNSHDPVSRSWSRQYRSAIFYHNEEQKKLALKSKEEQEARRGRIYTGIEQATTFYRAEDYHQKYFLRQRPDLMRELLALYSNDRDIVDSTAAARINGYLSANGACAATRSELSELLPPGKDTRLPDMVCRPN